MAYGYRNGSDVESDNLMAARELANNPTRLNAAERAALPEAYMSIEQLPRVTVSGVSQATRENAREVQRLQSRSGFVQAANFIDTLAGSNAPSLVPDAAFRSRSWWTGDARAPSMTAIDVAAERAHAAQSRSSYRMLISAAGGAPLTGYAALADVMGAPPDVYDNITQVNAGLVSAAAAPLTSVGSVSLLPKRVPLGTGMGSLAGEAEVAPRNAPPEQLRSIQRQNDALELMSKSGFDVVQLPNAGPKGVKNPDAAINGQLADVYSPTSRNLWTVRDYIAQKVEVQAPNVVVNLVDSPLTPSQVFQHLQQNPVPYNNLVLIKSGRMVVVGR